MDGNAGNLKSLVASVIKEKGYERREVPFVLASGKQSHDYVDCRRALSLGSDLGIAARCAVAMLEEAGIPFGYAGGLTMGADPLAHAISVVTGKYWFSVRKQSKDHGLQNRVEGAVLSPGDRVVAVEDVVSSGGSLLSAMDAIEESGATIVATVCVLERSPLGRSKVIERGVPYLAMATYEDLGIEPI